MAVQVDAVGIGFPLGRLQKHSDGCVRRVGIFYPWYDRQYLVDDFLGRAWVILHPEKHANRYR